jgi:RecB family endonuclease NucS
MNINKEAIMAQIIVGDKSPIQDYYPFAGGVHDMGDFIVAHPEILGPEVEILARELQVPTIAGLKRLDSRIPLFRYRFTLSLCRHS